MSATPYKLYVNSEAHRLLHTLDRSFVGTPEYMGLAYFWNYEYRFALRDATSCQRKRVHDAMLAIELPLDEASPQHEQIIRRHIRNAALSNA